MFTANNGTVNFMLEAANQERYPFFEAGAVTRLVPDDGSAAWRMLYQRGASQRSGLCSRTLTLSIMVRV